MVSIVWKQSYEISYLMASLSLLFYCILDKKSDFNILTDIFGLVAQAKSACGGDEVGHSACFRRHKPRLSRPWFSFGGSKLLFGGSILSFGGSKPSFGGGKLSFGRSKQWGSGVMVGLARHLLSGSLLIKITVCAAIFRVVGIVARR